MQEVIEPPASNKQRINITIIENTLNNVYKNQTRELKASENQKRDQTIAAS